MGDTQDEESDLHYITRKGGTVLVHDVYFFYRVKTFKKTSAVLWRCAEYKKKKCTGNIIVKVSQHSRKSCFVNLHAPRTFQIQINIFKIFQDGKVTRKKNHSCASDFSKIVVANEIESLKNKVKNTDLPLTQLYKDSVDILESKGLNMVTQIPSFSSIQHNLYTIRNKSLGVKKTIYSDFEEVEVPIKFAQLVLANYFYEGSRIIVFCSKRAREIIADVTEYFGDATFSCCPKPFQQLYILHGDIGSTITTTKVVPLIYVLMPNKKQESYSIVFDLIKSQLPNFNPKTMHLDFEKAAINAILCAFPHVTLRGCFYHWKRAIWKKAKKLGLKSKGEKRIAALIAALPLIPHESIKEGLEYVKSESSDSKKMLLFLKYVESFWLSDKFSEILCVFGERHRTNNTAESYHSKLNKEVNKRNATVINLLKGLTKLETSSFKTTSKRRKIYIDNDDDIMGIQLQLLNGEIPINFALEKLR